MVLTTVEYPEVFLGIPYTGDVPIPVTIKTCYRSVSGLTGTVSIR
jgi:hypothetical protein